MKLPFGAGSNEPRQRWRLVFARAADAPESLMPGSVALETFVAHLEAAEVIVARSANRPRVALAAPLPVGMSGDRELADLFVTDRLPIASVRPAIEGALPPGHDLVDLWDVWLGELALSAQLEAADYRVEVGPVDGGADVLNQVCRSVLAAQFLLRTRAKGGRDVTYDLRPLLADVRATDANGATVLEIRTRLSPERGAGRPDEVVAAVAEVAGLPLTAGRTRRVRLWLAPELPRI